MKNCRSSSLYIPWLGRVRTAGPVGHASVELANWLSTVSYEQKCCNSQINCCHKSERTASEIWPAKQWRWWHDDHSTREYADRILWFKV